MTKQTIFSLLIIIIVAVAMFFLLRNTPRNTVHDTGNVIGGMQTPAQMGKLPAGSTPPPQTSELVGTWGWKHNIVGGDALVPPNKPGVFAITFTADGKISGTTDCNGFGGEYKLGSDGVISFGPFMSTQMYCEGSQESDFTTSLAQTTRITKDAAGNLVMILGETSNVMVFSKK